VASEYSPYVERLGRIPGVRGAFVVSTRDGLVVDGRFSVGLRGPAVAALAAKLFNRAVRSLEGAGFGRVRFLQLDAADGRLVMAGDEDLLLVAVAEPRANLGLTRLETVRAADEMLRTAGSAAGRRAER
jgi:predicted regulator of Ras-like GTPase activity (Roadblock/LC7/MglB family)